MEEWKPVVGYELYQVSSTGIIKNKHEHVMSTHAVPGGYLQVQFSNSGKSKSKLVHCVVAEAFVPNPDNMREVDHINRNRTDNRVENLRWSTRRDNCLNTHRHDREMYGITLVKNRYKVRLTFHNRNITIGRYRILDDAKKARDDALVNPRYTTRVDLPPVLVHPTGGNDLESDSD